MRRLAIILAGVVVLALLVGAVFGVRPSLDEKESSVNDRWTPIVDALGARYDSLSILARTVGEASDRPREVVDETLGDVEAWWNAIDQDAGAEEQVVIANRLEGLAARLEATVVASSRLAGHEAVIVALEGLTATAVPTGIVESYNDAVRRYDDARTSLTGQPVAAVFGFGSRTAFEPVPTRT